MVIKFVIFQGYCQGFHNVLDVYNQIAQSVRLSGPTNFAPLIYKAIDLIKQAKSVSFPPNL